MGNQEEVTGSADLDRACPKCGNTPRMLETQAPLINTCAKCHRLSTSLSRIRGREARRGKPKQYGGSICRRTGEPVADYGDDPSPAEVGEEN